MEDVEMFLSTDDEQEIVSAIGIAEKNTSGEIRVHIEKKTTLDPFERAKEVFNLLKMDETQLRNGVLIYVAIENKAFAICGDKGINEVVEPDFWDSTKDIMLKHFKEKQYKEGIVKGVLRAGDRLKEYFAWQTDDYNELSNEISRG